MGSVKELYLSIYEGIPLEESKLRIKKKSYPLSVVQTVTSDRESKRLISLIQEHLHVKKVIQIDRFEYIRYSFRNAENYLCFFFRKVKDGSELVKNVFYGINEVFVRLEPYLRKHRTWDTYISYSTYISKRKEYVWQACPVYTTDEQGNQVPLIQVALDGSQYCPIEWRKKLKAQRTQEKIKRTHMLVQDLDYYKEGLSFEQALDLIAELIDNGRVPMPNILLTTGTGMQLVWLIEPTPMKRGYTYDKKWRAIQEYLFDQFDKQGLHPDTVVKNPSAVTRLEGTTNQKNGKTVRAFMIRDDVWPLERMFDECGLIPIPDAKRVPRPKTDSKSTNKRGRVVPLVKAWNAYTLNAQRLEDFFTYVIEGQKMGMSMVGRRAFLALLVRFYSLVVHDGDDEIAKQNVRRLWSLIEDKSGTSEEEILRRSEPAVRYWQEWKGLVEWQGEGKYLYPGLFYKNSTLIERLKIPVELQVKLRTIKIRNKEYERVKAELNRREKGTVGREEYLNAERNKTQEKLNMLRQLLHQFPNAKQSDLAKMMRVSPARISQLKKLLN